MSTLPKPVTDTFNQNPYMLAGAAGTPSPDSPTSPGAVFLSRVQTSALETLDYVDLSDFLDDPSSAMDEATHEIADGAVPVYTHELWATFVDLGAYGEDISDFVGDDIGSNLERVPGIALYSIARRLAESLFSEACDALSTAVDEARDTAEDAGTLQGTEAARWWAQDNIGGRVTGDVVPVARAVFDGIENGDPVVLDSLPSADLSGQWADGVTVSDLLGADLVGLDTSSVTAQEIGDVYVEAFDTAVQAEVQRLCQEVIDGRF